MDKAKKKQMLIESFDILKDLWEEKEKAIRKIWFEMWKIDKPLTVEMWKYILNNNEAELKQSYNNLVTGFLNEIICQESGLYDTDKLIDLIPYISNDIQLLETIFLRNHSNEDEVAELFAIILSHGNISDSQYIIELLGKVNYSQSYNNIGDFMTKVIECLNYDSNPLSNGCKDLLENFISNIQGKTERAEAFVAFLSLN